MSRTKVDSKVVPVRSIRCAIYTRKSSEEGLEQEFNSLDAQRESGEAYIASQKNEGWATLPDRYDDGGFSGGNMERPALVRLLADIRAGKIDCVVVYKVDRLSRSLFDFGRIIETFEKHHVSFVSVTQHFNTTNSMGRLTLNILLSFAQFEREIIGERIRDKIAAQRRRGKWSGGIPVLGYDVDRTSPSPRLVINAEEAARVRHLFSLYLEKGSLLPVVRELAQRTWANKTWKTKGGRTRGGRPFDKTSLYVLLTNPIYMGKIRHKADLYDGEHSPIVAPETFTKVQNLLQHNGRSGGFDVRNRYGALLRSLLHCKACGRAMVHTFTSSRGKRGQVYRYYTCTTAIKNGAGACSSGSLPAAEIERTVVDQIRCIAHDPELRAEVLREARAGVDAELAGVQTQRADIDRELAHHHTEIRKLALSASCDTAATTLIADLHERVRRGRVRLSELDVKASEFQREQVDDEDVATAFSDFDNVWTRLSPKEQARILTLLIARVDYDASEGSVAITLHAPGIKSLVGEIVSEAA